MAVINILSVSGGKDSTAAYILAVELFGKDFLAIMGDTGNEHPVTLNYVRNLHTMVGGPQVIIVQRDFATEIRGKRKRLIADAKKALDVWKEADLLDVLTKGMVEEYNSLLYRARNCVPSGNPFLDMMLWKGRAPSAAAQFCTEAVKLWPIHVYMEENYPLDEWVMYTGLRAGESEARSRRQPFEYNDYFDCDSVNPMIYSSREDVFALLESKGIPPNPLYALGYNRVGCFPCIHSNKNELELLPEWAWDKLDEWERRIGRTWFAPDTMPPPPAMKAELKKANGDPEAIKRIKLKYLPTIANVRQWCKTKRGGVQYDVFKMQSETADAPACMSTWGICE